MLYKRCLNLSGEYMNPIKPDTLQSIQFDEYRVVYQFTNIASVRFRLDNAQ